MLYLDIGITREATLKQRLLSLAAKKLATLNDKEFSQIIKDITVHFCMLLFVVSGHLTKYLNKQKLL